MARINNLTNFLTDVASAIKTKKDSNTPISAANFDIEILALPSQGTYQQKTVTITQNGLTTLTPDSGYDAMDEVGITVNVPIKQLQSKTVAVTSNGNVSLLPDTGYDGFNEVNLEVNVPTGGIDTSDATATANDILAPETAYVKGQKITGNIITSYEYINGAMGNDNISLVNDMYIQDIMEDLGYAIVGQYLATSISLYNYSNDNISTLKHTFDLSNLIASAPKLVSVNIGRQVIDYGNIILWLVTVANINTSSQPEYVSVIEYNPNTDEVENCVTVSCSSGNQLNRPSSIAVNPVNAKVAGFIHYTTFNAGGSWMQTTPNLFRYNDRQLIRTQLSTYDGDNGNPANVMQSEWDSTGTYLIGFKNGKLNPNGIMLCKYVSSTGTFTRIRYMTKSEVDGKIGTILDNNCGFYNCGYFNFETNTLIHTYSELANCTSNKALMWIYSGYLFIVEYFTTPITLKCYKVVFGNNNYPELQLCFTEITSAPLANADIQYAGSVQIPSSNHSNFYFKTLRTGFRFKLVNGAKHYESVTMHNATFINTDLGTDASKILLGEIGYNSSGKITGTMPNNGTLNYTPSTSQQTIPAGYTSGGTILPVTNSQEYLDALDLTEQILGEEENE